MIAIGNKIIDDVRLGWPKIAKVHIGDRFVYSPNLYKTVVKENDWIFAATTASGSNEDSDPNFPYSQGEPRRTLFLPVEEGEVYLWKIKTKGDRFVVWYIFDDITPSLKKIHNTNTNVKRGVSHSNANVRNRYIISPPTGTKWLMIYYNIAKTPAPDDITINKL